MSIQSRVNLYSKVEALRERPLMVYVTSPRANAAGQMGADVIPEICNQIDKLSTTSKSIDLLIVSNGGDAMVAWRTMSILREKFDYISVLVPQTAYSAATLLAIGADEIVMHPFANLGPIDPQIKTHRKRKDGVVEAINFGSEDMEGFLEFAREKVGLSDQTNILEVFKLFCAEAGPIPIGIATRSSQLSHQLGIKMLQNRKRKSKDDRAAKSIVDRLNKQFFNHGYALNRREAKEIGLQVVYPPQDLEKAMWDLWCGIAADIKANEPFIEMTIVANDPRMASLFSSPPSLEIPSNTPPQLVQQIWQQALSKVAIAKFPEIEYTIPRAVLESTWHQRMYVEKGKIAPSRGPNGGANITRTPTSSLWTESVDSAT